MPTHRARKADIGSGLTARLERDGGLSFLREGLVVFAIGPRETVAALNFLRRNALGQAIDNLDATGPRRPDGIERWPKLGPRGGELRYPEIGERYRYRNPTGGWSEEIETCLSPHPSSVGKPCRPEEHEIVPQGDPA